MERLKTIGLVRLIVLVARLGCSAFLALWVFACSGCGKSAPTVSEKSTQAIFEAIDKGRLVDVKKLLTQEPDVVYAVAGGSQVGSVVNVSEGDTPIHFAAKSDDLLEIARALLKGGADVNAPNGSGETPLHRAGWWGELKMASLFLSSKADIAATDNEGRTPLHSVADTEPFESADGIMDSAPEMAALFVSKGADVNAKDNSGATPLHLAALHGHDRLVKFLISKGADVNVQTTAAMTVTSVINGLSANSMSEHEIAAGATPLSLATDAGVRDILKQHGAK